MDKTISRKEKRFTERIETEAKQLHERLAENFQSFFLSAENPDGPEIQDRIKQVSAQWKTYCHRNNLKEEAYPLIQNFCDNLVKEYKEVKDGKEVIETVSDNG